MIVMSELPKSFAELIETSALPVLADFFAEWCGPCKMVSPIIQRLAGEYKGRILTVKLDIDRHPEIASRFQVMGVPTIIMFSKGQVLFRLTGAYPYEEIRDHINRNLL
jgi:thioredoxin